MTIDKDFNPLENGYTFPAEWEEHEATWLSWPHKEESWPERINLIYPAYAKFIAEPFEAGYGHTIGKIHGLQMH